jgi:hypothetical protein
VSLKINVVPDFENFDFNHINRWLKKWSGQRVSYKWMFYKICKKYGIPKNNNCSGLVESSADDHFIIWSNFIDVLNDTGVISIEDGWITIN